MNKRKALAAAGAITVTAVAGALAVGAAFGMVGVSDASSTTGRLSPATELVQTATAPEPTPIVQTVVIDVPAPSTSGTSSGDPSVASTSDPTTDVVTSGGDHAIDDPRSTPAFEDDDHGETEDSHADEDDHTKTGGHANEDTHEDEDD